MRVANGADPHHMGQSGLGVLVLACTRLAAKLPGNLAHLPDPSGAHGMAHRLLIVTPTLIPTRVAVQVALTCFAPSFCLSLLSAKDKLIFISKNLLGGFR